MSQNSLRSGDSKSTSESEGFISSLTKSAVSYLFIHSLCEVSGNDLGFGGGFFFFGLTSRMRAFFIISFKLREGVISPVLVSNYVILQDPGLLYW